MKLRLTKSVYHCIFWMTSQLTELPQIIELTRTDELQNKCGKCSGWRLNPYRSRQYWRAHFNHMIINGIINGNVENRLMAEMNVVMISNQFQKNRNKWQKKYWFEYCLSDKYDSSDEWRGDVANHFWAIRNDNRSSWRNLLRNIRSVHHFKQF
jgi:hypothetical protein